MSSGRHGISVYSYAHVSQTRLRRQTKGLLMFDGTQGVYRAFWLIFGSETDLHCQAGAMFRYGSWYISTDVDTDILKI